MLWDHSLVRLKFERPTRPMRAMLAFALLSPVGSAVAAPQGLSSSGGLF